MAITSLDIQNVSFSIDRKGYDVDEVDVFLERVADEIDALNAEIEELRSGAGDIRYTEPVEEQATSVMEPVEVEGANAYAFDDSEFQARIADLEAALAEKNAVIIELNAKLAESPSANESVIAQALIVAQRSADEVVANANIQSEQIISDAREDAANIVAAANEEKSTIEAEIKELEEDRESARGQYSDLLRNFINDATNKLSDIEERKAAHNKDKKPVAASAEVTGRVMSKNQIPVNEGASTPAASATVQVTPVTPKPSVEKDLSGFGDADDFSFEELD